MSIKGHRVKSSVYPSIDVMRVLNRQLPADLPTLQRYHANKGTVTRCANMACTIGYWIKEHKTGRYKRNIFRKLPEEWLLDQENTVLAKKVIYGTMFVVNAATRRRFLVRDRQIILDHEGLNKRNVPRILEYCSDEVIANYMTMPIGLANIKKPTKSAWVLVIPEGYEDRINHVVGQIARVLAE